MLELTGKACRTAQMYAALDREVPPDLPDVLKIVKVASRYGLAFSSGFIQPVARADAPESGAPASSIARRVLSSHQSALRIMMLYPPLAARAHRHHLFRTARM